MTDDDGKKTRRLDDEYFREIAKQAKTQKLDSDKTQILSAGTGNMDPDSSAGSSAHLDGNRTRYSSRKTARPLHRSQRMLQWRTPQQVGWWLSEDLVRVQ